MWQFVMLQISEMKNLAFKKKKKKKKKKWGGKRKIEMR